MKFDIILSNPPYQPPGPVIRSKLWHKFLTASLDKWSKQNTILLFITPSSWFKSPSSARNHKLSLNIAQHWLQYINLNATKDYFPSIGEDICHYIIYKGYKGTTEVVWDKIYDIEYKGGFPILNPKDQYKVNIFNKMRPEDKSLRLARLFKFDYKEITGNWRTYIKQGIMSDQPTEKHNTEVYYNSNKTVYGEPKATGWRCYVNNSGYLYHPVKQDKYTWVGKDKTYFGGVFGFDVNTEQEGRNMISYLTSKPYRYYLKIAKGNGASFNQPLLQSKALDVTRSWTDQDVYEHFEFSQDEINLIEETLKDNKAI